MDDQLMFWDEDCLSGTIDRAPLPPPPRSLFENNLFCDEYIDPLPFPSENPFPLIPQLPLLPPSPPPPNPRPWRSFLDDNCPLRRRVKVTITPQSRVKRPANFPTPSPKKPRPSTPSSLPPRRLQTKLRLQPSVSSTSQPSRITLHIPSQTQPPIHNLRPDPRKLAPRLPTSPDPPSPTKQLHPTPPPMRPRVSGAPHAAFRPSRRVGQTADSDDIDAGPGRSRNCISIDLDNRLSTMKRLDGRKGPTRPHTESLMLPLVDAAVSAVTVAAQRYSSLVNHVAASPGALSGGWATLAAAGLGGEGRSGKGKPKGKGKGKAIQIAKRKRGRRRRTLLSFDDHDVAPVFDSGLGPRRGESSALARYLDSPSSSRKLAVARA